MFPNCLPTVSDKRDCIMLNIDLRMHGAKDVGHYQAASTSVGVKLYVLAAGKSTNTVEGNRTLNCGVNALDGNSDNTPLVVRQVNQKMHIPVGRSAGCWSRRVVMRGTSVCACWREVDEVVRDAQVGAQDHVNRSVVLGTQACDVDVSGRWVIVVPGQRRRQYSSPVFQNAYMCCRAMCDLFDIVGVEATAGVCCCQNRWK
jgi:hypothetical protein